MSLYRNIQAKRRRIKAGSGEKMRKAGAKGAPTKKNFTRAKQTVKKKTDQWQATVNSKIFSTARALRTRNGRRFLAA